MVVRSQPLDGGTPDHAGALVTGADYRALGVVRSLGRRRVPVWVLRSENDMLAATSRYACGTLSWPGGNEVERADFLASVAKRHGLKGWVLFPTDDEAVALLAPEMILIQEFVPGWGETQFSYAALCLDGRPLAWLVARRARQFPMDFGRFSTYVETVDEPGIIEPSIRLLGSIRYTGLVEIEFKRDPRDGRYKVLDVNPRVWGC